MLRSGVQEQSGKHESPHFTNKEMRWGGAGESKVGRESSVFNRKKKKNLKEVGAVDTCFKFLEIKASLVYIRSTGKGRGTPCFKQNKKI